MQSWREEATDWKQNKIRRTSLLSLCCSGPSNTLKNIQLQIHQVGLQGGILMLVLQNNFCGAGLREEKETSWTLWSHFWRLRTHERLDTLQTTQSQQTQTNFAMQNPWSGQPVHRFTAPQPADQATGGCDAGMTATLQDTVPQKSRPFHSCRLCSFWLLTHLSGAL